MQYVFELTTRLVFDMVTKALIEYMLYFIVPLKEVFMQKSFDTCALKVEQFHSQQFGCQLQKQVLDLWSIRIPCHF